MIVKHQIQFSFELDVKSNEKGEIISIKLIPKNTEVHF
jgi:hypothetical protein